MAEGGKPSFGRLVIKRAWFSAWEFFDSWKRDTVLACASIVVGEVSYYRQHGLPATVLDLVYNALHLVAPLAIVWGILFLWHFWLAPYALVYEAARASAAKPSTVTAPQPQKKKTLREALGAWAHVDRFKVSDAACLWAGFLPGGSYLADKIQKEGVVGAERLIVTELQDVLDERDVRPMDEDLGNAYVSRADLLALATRKGIRPGFLYPDG
jgi:hypothetical protein